MTTPQSTIYTESSASQSTEFMNYDPGLFDRLREERLQRIQELREKQQAAVGEFNGENGRKYEVTSNGNQTTTTIIDVETQVVVHEGITSAGGGVVANLPADYAQTEAAAFANAEAWQLTKNDLAVAQGKLEEAVAGGNLTKPTGLSNIPPAEGNAVINGKPLNPDFGKADNDPIKHLEFGQVDHILRRLSLRNLKYPIDADYGNTQDYMQINQFTYRPPNKGIFFPEGGLEGGIKKGVDTFLKGVDMGTPKEKAIGLVKLPMCNSLVDSNNVAWGPDKLNALTAAISSAAMGASGGVIDSVQEALRKFDDGGITFGNLIQSVGGIAADTAVGAVKGLGAVAGAGGDLMGALKDPRSNANLLGRTVIGSAILNAAQLEVSPETILSRGQGVVPNNNLALLFNSPTLREFEFAWKMSPRSKEEAIRINNILRFFKQGMAPKKAVGTKSGGASYFLGTPNVFDIHFKTGRSDSDFYEILDRNDSVMRIKTCALTGVAVNYTPQGMWNAYEKGQPVSITLTLRFNELEPVFDTDYDDNYFNYDPQRTDLLPVPMDAVGY